MNGKLLTVLAALVSMTVGLAGCTGSDEVNTVDSIDANSIDKSTFDLGNQGAISGLIVDDNYRPVQLKEDWGGKTPGDYQDTGFVLVLETAQRFETTENGEFNVLPLKPGTYTIRVAADNHEAIDRTVTVVAGEFSEVTVEARRTFSKGGSILSQEYVIFISCTAAATGVGYVAVGSIGGCGDTSGDSGRFSFDTNYASIASDVRGMVTEVRTHQDGYYLISMRTATCPQGGWCYYAQMNLENERYDRVAILVGEAYNPRGEPLQEGQEGWCDPSDQNAADCASYFAFRADYQWQTAIFPDVAHRYWQDQVTEPASEAFNSVSPGPTVGRHQTGTGVTLGTKAQFIQNIFLYQIPEEGIEGYCVLCSDADIPQ